MIRLFKKRTDKPSMMYPVFQRLGAVIDKRQRQCASFLFSKFEKLSKRLKLWWLLSFCLFFGGGALYVFVSAIENKGDRLFIYQLSFPQHVTGKDTMSFFHPSPIIDESQYQKMQRIEKYLDSLRGSASGRVIYDSIVKARKGLLDSMLFIKNIYQQHLKSK